MAHPYCPQMVIFVFIAKWCDSLHEPTSIPLTQSIQLRKYANSPMRLLVVFVLSVSVCIDTACQDDTPFHKMNKKELLEKVVTLTLDRDQFEMDLVTTKAELRRAKADLNAQTKSFEDSLSLIRGKLTSCYETLKENEQDLVSANKVIEDTSSPRLAAKIQSLRDSWGEMCAFERVRALCNKEERDWYTLLLSEITPPNEIVSRCANDLIPHSSFGCACPSFSGVFTINDDWYVAFWDWDGDFESSAFTSMTLFSESIDTSPKTFVVKSPEEIYVSSNCELLVSRSNENPCMSPGLNYDFFLFNETHIGKTNIDAFSEEFYRNGGLPYSLESSVMELQMGYGSASLEQYEIEAGERSGERKTIFSLSNAYSTWDDEESVWDVLTLRGGHPALRFLVRYNRLVEVSEQEKSMLKKACNDWISAAARGEFAQVEEKNLFCDEIMNPERRSILTGINEEMQSIIASIQKQDLEILDLSFISMKTESIEWPGSSGSCEKKFAILNMEFLESGKDPNRSRSTEIEFLWSDGSLFLIDGN